MPPPPPPNPVAIRRHPQPRVQAVTASPPLPPSEPPAPSSSLPSEEAIFDFLRSHTEGARLTEIESTLGINRFQAVDALRSLIQKELIVQKDRTYRILEESVL
jgi:hypothetical protein